MIMFLIVLSAVQTKSNFTLLDYFSGDYKVYTSNINGEDCVNLGFCYMGSTPGEDCVIGECITIDNLEVASALSTLKARVVKTEYLEDGTTIIYAHTGLIQEVVEVSGARVNLQIATRENRSVIGWPLILGSY